MASPRTAARIRTTKSPGSTDLGTSSFLGRTSLKAFVGSGQAPILCGLGVALVQGSRWVLRLVTRQRLHSLRRLFMAGLARHYATSLQTAQTTWPCSFGEVPFAPPKTSKLRSIHKVRVHMVKNPWSRNVGTHLRLAEVHPSR